MFVHVGTSLLKEIGGPLQAWRTPGMAYSQGSSSSGCGMRKRLAGSLLHRGTGKPGELGCGKETPQERAERQAYDAVRSGIGESDERGG